jgi:hypothetical protein
MRTAAAVLSEGDFPSRLERAIARSGAAPRLIEGVTQSVASQNERTTELIAHRNPVY